MRILEFELARPRERWIFQGLSNCNTRLTHFVTIALVRFGNTPCFLAICFMYFAAHAPKSLFDFLSSSHTRGWQNLLDHEIVFGQLRNATIIRLSCHAKVRITPQQAYSVLCAGLDASSPQVSEKCTELV